MILIKVIAPDVEKFLSEETVIQIFSQERLKTIHFKMIYYICNRTTDVLFKIVGTKSAYLIGVVSV